MLAIKELKIRSIFQFSADHLKNFLSYGTKKKNPSCIDEIVPIPPFIDKLIGRIQRIVDILLGKQVKEYVTCMKIDNCREDCERHATDWPEEYLMLIVSDFLLCLVYERSLATLMPVLKEEVVDFRNKTFQNCSILDSLIFGIHIDEHSDARERRLALWRILTRIVIFMAKSGNNFHYLESRISNLVYKQF